MKPLYLSDKKIERGMPRQQAGGFTLVEQLLVLVLIIVLLAFGGVRMMKTMRSNSLELAAKNMQTALRYLQVKAVEEEKVYELSIQEGGRNIAVKKQEKDGEDFTPVRSSWLKAMEVGRSLTLELERGGKLLFFPDGSSSRNRLVIRDESGERRLLELKNRIGTVDIKSA